MFQARQQIGLYTLIKRIGRGGFGEVWLAERRAKFVTTKVAVKLPLEDQVDHEAIKHEAVLWEQANGHSNVLPIIDADEYDGQIVIVSEYAPDGSLDDLLQAKKTLPIKKAVEFTIGILSGLEFLHSRKIIHRDIKPANILLQGETPKLADFGISRVMKTTNVSMTLSGTPPYMAPEAFDRKRTAQTDIWSVGVILYQMLEGSLPFPHNNLTDLLGAIVRDEPEPFLSSVPEDLQRIVFKALAKKSEERYQTALEMRNNLSDFLINISQRSVESTKQQSKSQNEQLATILPLEKQLKSKSSESLAQTQSSSTAKGSDFVIDTAGRRSAETQSSKDVLELPNFDSEKTKDNSLKIKLFVPFGLLILLVIGALYFYISNSKISKNQNTNQNTSVASDEVQLIPYLKGNKFGFCDKSRNLVVKPKYDFVKPFSEGLAIINIGRKYDYENHKIITKGKFGVIDIAGKEILPPKYDNIEDFSDNVAIVRVGEKYANGQKTDFGKAGLIDRTGKEILLPKYDNIEEFHEGLAIVELNNKVGFIDITGTIVVPILYDTAKGFSEGLALVNKGVKRTRTLDSVEISNGGQFGYIDKNGKEIIPLQFDIADSFNDGLAPAVNSKVLGFIDTTGSLKVRLEYYASSPLVEGLARVRADRVGFIDKTGKEIIPFSYDDANDFSEGFSVVKVNSGQQAHFGFIDKTSREITSIKYDSAKSFMNGLAAVNIGQRVDTTSSKTTSYGKWGFINTTGKEAIALKYDLDFSVLPFGKGFALVSFTNKQFYISKDGTEYYEP